MRNQPILQYRLKRHNETGRGSASSSRWTVARELSKPWSHWPRSSGQAKGQALQKSAGGGRDVSPVCVPMRVCFVPFRRNGPVDTRYGSILYCTLGFAGWLTDGRYLLTTPSTVQLHSYPCCGTGEGSRRKLPTCVPAKPGAALLAVSGAIAECGCPKKNAGLYTMLVRSAL